MKYEDLYDEFINLFPEDKEFFKRFEEETGAERSIGMHIMLDSWRRNRKKQRKHLNLLRRWKHPRMKELLMLRMLVYWKS